MGLSHRASLYFSTSKISLFLSLPLSLVHLSICTVTTHILSVKLACCCDTGASIYLSICKCRSTLTHTQWETALLCVCKIHVLLCVPLFGLALLTQMVISGDYLCMYLLLHPAALLGRSGPTNHSTTSILLLQESQTDTHSSPRRI